MTMTPEQMRQQMAAGATQPGLEGPPEFKFTQPGEEVFGVVTAARYGFNTVHGPGNVIEVNDFARGALTLWASNVQLEAGIVQGRNQLGRAVAVGDLIYVRFDGQTALDGGKTVKNFAINVQAGQQPQQAPSQQPAQVPAPQPQQQPGGWPQQPQPVQPQQQPVQQQGWPQQPPQQPVQQQGWPQPGGQPQPTQNVPF